MAFFLELLGLGVRAGLIALSGVLINHGWVSAVQASVLTSGQFVAGAVTLVATVAYAAYKKYGARVKFLFAAGSGQTLTEQDVKDAIAKGAKVDVMTPKDETPQITGGEK